MFTGNLQICVIVILYICVKNRKDPLMGSFFRKPFVYAITFGLALTLLFAWSLLSVFVIPKELETPNEEYETIDFSRFTKPDFTDTAAEPSRDTSEESTDEPAEEEPAEEESAEEEESSDDEEE